MDQPVPAGVPAQEVSSRMTPPRSHRLALVLIILLAAGLRLWRLDEAPPAINQDEAVHAYDAWSLAKTGRDHDGAAWPIFFKAFGDYHPGPFVYLLVPFQALLGLGVWSARLPGAMVGVLAAPLAYLLLRRSYGDRTALIGAVLTAVSPWQMHISRMALEAGICPAMLMGGLAALYAGRPTLAADDRAAARARQLLLLALSGLLLGLASWTYHAMRVFVPLLLIAAAIVHRRSLRGMVTSSAARLNGIVWFGGALLGLAPFLVAWIIAPDQVWARATSVAVLDSPDGLPGILRNYFSNLSPRFLFLDGDEYVVQSVPEFGQLHYYAMILLPIGAWRAWHDRRSRPLGLLLLIWAAAAPVPAALAAWPSGHSLRSIALSPALELLCAIGLAAILDAIARSRPVAYKASSAVSAIIIALNVGWFARTFWGSYPVAAAPAFQAEWREVFAEVDDLRGDYDMVLLSTASTNQLGLLYMFWTAMEPAAYLASDHELESAGIVERIIRIDNVVFRPGLILPTLAPGMPPGFRVLVAERPEFPVPGKVLRRFYHPDGREAVILYDVRAEDIPRAEDHQRSEPSRIPPSARDDTGS